MKKRNLTNKEVDKIGSNLLKVTNPSDEEIENIVADPKLFDSITDRIKVEEKVAVESKQGLLIWDWLKPSFLHRQMAISAVAILLVFFVFVAMIFVSNQEPDSFAKEKKSTVEQDTLKKEFAQSEKPLRKTKTESPEKNVVSKPEEQPKFQPIVFKKKQTKKLKPVRKKTYVKRKKKSTKKSVKRKTSPKTNGAIDKSTQLAKNEPKKVFYMLPYSGNTKIKKENVKIVSAKLSRSELFALGVNLQLENESSTVETELLIGNDGVARAIRVIEKF